MHAELFAVGEHHRAEDRVLELAHVARPAIGREQGEGVRAPGLDAVAFLGWLGGEYMRRMSPFMFLRAPTGSASPPCSARNNLAGAAGGNSPTSSRNSVPPSASMN